jgi:SAM-dependent MidA family methyltransferase
VNSGLKPWLWALHDRMQQGVILTVDYGQSGEDRYAPHRADGTLLAYQSHERFDDPLGEPGLRDITAQVDFTALAIQARETGFEILGYSDQHHFLVSTAEPWLRSLGDSKHGAFTEEKQRDLRALQTLLHPGTMGRQFKAIAFGKNFGTIPLSCFRHQRPGIEALGSI